MCSLPVTGWVCHPPARPTHTRLQPELKGLLRPLAVRGRLRAVEPQRVRCGGAWQLPLAHLTPPHFGPTPPTSASVVLLMRQPRGVELPHPLWSSSTTRHLVRSKKRLGGRRGGVGLGGLRGTFIKSFKSGSSIWACATAERCRQWRSPSRAGPCVQAPPRACNVDRTSSMPSCCLSSVHA